MRNKELRKIQGSIDIVVIQNSTRIDIEWFPITKEKEARQKAQELTEYHNKPFYVIIRNEPKAKYPHLGG